MFQKILEFIAQAAISQAQAQAQANAQTQSNVFQKNIRIDSATFLKILSVAGKVQQGNNIIIDPAKEYVHKVQALKFYCGYSEDKDLHSQIIAAKKIATRDINKNYVVQIKT